MPSASLVAKLAAVWFTPAPAARLGLLRILIGGWAFYYLARRRKMMRQVAATDPHLFAPVGVAKVHPAPLPARLVNMLVHATLVANVAFILGWRHRVTGPLYSGLFLWLLSYRNSWSMIFHNDNVMVLHILTLGLTRSADAWSLDALGKRPPTSWQYGWPIRLMNTMTVLTYFVSGVAKVKGPLGWTWATGESLRSQVAVDALRKELLGSAGAPLAPRLYHAVGLFRLLAIGSLALELGAPLALAHRWLARGWAANAFLLHWGIYAVMKITFRYQMAGIMYLSFFEVERVGAWVLTWIARRWEEGRR